MRQVLLALAFCCVAGAAGAQEQKPDVVLLPREVAQAALDWIATPNPMMAVRLYSTLQACLQDNPHNGATMRMGGDQCPVVSEAIAARAKEVENLQKQLADAKTPKEGATKP